MKIYFLGFQSINMKHYNKKNNCMFKILEKDGFICEASCSGKNKFWVYKDDGEKFLVHSGERSYHPLRRFLKNYYNYIFVF